MDMLFSITALKGFEIKQLIMVLISCVLAYLAIKKKYEPLLLLPISFGMLIANIPGAFMSAYGDAKAIDESLKGLLFYLYQGIHYQIYPPMIFLCLGAMTDFGPLIANPKTAFIGLGGQLGIFVALFGALAIGEHLAPFIPGLRAFSMKDAIAIGIIGSSDGPTSIYTATRLAPDLLPTVAIAAYSYMALIPVIQPPIMRALTTAKERVIVMPEPKQVTQKQKIFFPIIVTFLTLLLVPAAASLIAMLMLGNLIKESGVADRIFHSLQGDALNLLTMLIGLCIGATATADRFLTPNTVCVILLGLIAFCFGTIGGVLIAKLLCKITGGKINPLIGNAGVSAMPMAARVSQKVAQEYNPSNFVLMHAMGPIVSSTLGSAILAGILIKIFG